MIKKLTKRICHIWYVIRRRRYLKIDTGLYAVRQYGNEYGGFQIYDEKIKLKESAIVYSFGIGEDLSFSEDLMKKISPQIYAYDPTPRSIEYVKAHELSGNSNFHFFPIGLSDQDEIVRFYLPVNQSYVSGSAITHDGLKQEGIDVKMASIESLSKKNGHTSIDLMKIDIEGSEFKVIEALRNTDVIVNQICMEVHDEFFEDGIHKLKRALATMRTLGYKLISVSGRGTELTFLKTE